MAFYALLFSKNPDTSAVMKAACKSTGIRVEVCEDIFTAIEKGKTQGFSCVIADWAEQPEASFLLKRARESAPNRNTVAIAIVDRDPSAAELRDNRLDFLIYRPISVPEAEAVLTKASEKMQPSSAPVVAAPAAKEDDETSGSSVSPDGDVPQQALHSADDLAEGNVAGSKEGAEEEAAEEESRPERHTIGFRGVCATVLVIALAFCLWRSRAAVVYLSRTPEGTYRVLRESAEALFYKNQTGALPVGAAGSEAQQDAYFSRDAGASSSSNSNAQTPALGVVATESTLTESRMPLPKAADFPLPVPVFEHQEAAPVRVQRTAIPESMRNSPPIAGPVVVTVNPAQMMPVSAPQAQPAVQQLQRARRDERRCCARAADSQRESSLSSGSVIPEIARNRCASGASRTRRQR